MLNAIASPLAALTRVVRRTVAPQIPPTPRQLFSFDDSCRGIVTRHTAHWISDTHSTGNTGYVNRHTGQMALPGVRTTQVHKQEFWVDGVHRYTLTDRVDIGITEGHQVSILADRGQIAYILNHSTAHWNQVTALDNLLPSTPKPLDVFMTLFLALLVAPLVLCILAGVTMPAVAWVLRSFVGLPSTESMAAAGLAAMVLFGIVGPVYSFLWLFGRRRRAQRHQLAIYEQGRRELETACRDGLGIEPDLPRRALGFWGLWLGLPLLAFMSLFTVAALNDIYEDMAKPPVPPLPPPDYTAQLVGRWKTPMGIVNYTQDHTYTVTQATGGKLLESGTWSLSGTTLSYTVQAPAMDAGIGGKHFLQRVDASTLVYADPQTITGSETWQRVTAAR